MRLRRTLESHIIGDPQYAFSYPEYAHLRDHQNVLQDVIAVSEPFRVLASAEDEAQGSVIQFRPSQAEIVSPNYFGVLGINATLGRVFGPAENGGPGGNPVVVLSYPFWQRRYNITRGAVARESLGISSCIISAATFVPLCRVYSQL
jgi:hypothetical protein